MSNSFFKFKQFTINQGSCGMKITTDSILLGSWCNLENAENILDIGTGSGILALMASQKCSANINAIEPETEAFIQAIQNFQNSPFSNRIKAFNQTLQEFTPLNKNLFSHIICNPPYFSKSLQSSAHATNMARHNHVLPFNTLSDCAAQLLQNEGKLLLILPVNEFKEFNIEALKNSLYCCRKTSVKSFQHSIENRYLLMYTKTPDYCIEDTIIIYNNNKTYSLTFSKLTEAFYL